MAASYIDIVRNPTYKSAQMIIFRIDSMRCHNIIDSDFSCVSVNEVKRYALCKDEIRAIAGQWFANTEN